MKTQGEDPLALDGRCTRTGAVLSTPNGSKETAMNEREQITRQTVPGLDDEPGPYTINVLLKAIQSLSRRVENLEKAGDDTRVYSCVYITDPPYKCQCQACKEQS